MTKHSNASFANGGFKQNAGGYGAGRGRGRVTAVGGAGRGRGRGRGGGAPSMKELYAEVRALGTSGLSLKAQRADRYQRLRSANIKNKPGIKVPLPILRGMRKKALDREARLAAAADARGDATFRARDTVSYGLGHVALSAKEKRKQERIKMTNAVGRAITHETRKSRQEGKHKKARRARK